MGKLEVLRTVLLIGVCLPAAYGAKSNGMAPCYIGQTQMYHPDPSDTSRYIQCDKFGRAFIRHCNNGQVWSQAPRVCVTGSVTQDIIWDGNHKSVKTYRKHQSRKIQAKQGQTYSYTKPSTSTQTQYAETRYSAPKNKLHNSDYLISPLAFMYMLTNQPSSSNDMYRNSNERKSGHLTYMNRKSQYVPYQYYYHSTPASKSTINKRFKSTTHGAVRGSSHNTPHNTYSTARSGAKSIPYGTPPIIRPLNSHGQSSHNMVRQSNSYSSLPIYPQSYGAGNSVESNSYADERKSYGHMPYYASTRTNTYTVPKVYGLQGSFHSNGNSKANRDVSVQLHDTSFPPSYSMLDNLSRKSSYSGSISGENAINENHGNHFISSYQHHPVEMKSFNHRMDKITRGYSPVSSEHQPMDKSICLNDGVRYFPDPANEKQYYECLQDHTLVHRVCPGALVWVHSLRMCIDVKDKHNTVVPPMNPCVGSDAYFKAYPTDPSMYIECHTWHTVLVWTCHENQIWNTEKQHCEHTSEIQEKSSPNLHPKPQAHRHSQAPPVTAATLGSSPCDKTHYYFPYPGDASRFIQCDEFGKHFVKDCPSSTVWDENIKGCVRNMGYQPQTLPAYETNSYEYDFRNALPLNIKDYETDLYYNTGGMHTQYINVRADAKAYIEESCPGQNKLWIPSLRKCVSMADGIQNSDYCHHGDYYFKNYRICASIKVTDIEGKSLFGEGSHTLTYTDYESYASDSVKGDLNYCAAMYNVTDNPCMGKLMYYAFPHNNSCFIQCNEQAVPFLHTCPTAMIWNQDVLSCVEDRETEYETMDDSDSDSNDDFPDDFTSTIDSV